MLRRRTRFVSKKALGGAACGAALAAAWLLSGETTAFRAAAAAGIASACYLAGVVLAYRAQEAVELDYILRLREELRLCQDHIMETASFESLGAYLEIAAHQMREPLLAVRACVEALVADVSLTGQVRTTLEALRQKLGMLQASLRHLAAYTLTRPGRAPFSVNHLLRDAIRLCRHRAEEKKIVFDARYAVIPPVFGPAGRVEQAVLSVIINAIEAMPFGGGTIAVETAHENDRVVARVRDGGIGIKPEYLPHVFEPFFTTKPEKGGAGLGLWAARQTFDLIGADIGVRSAPFQGTEVTIVFPQAAPLRPGREGTTHPPELPRNTAGERDRRIA